jgi:hypothetical protein
VLFTVTPDGRLRARVDGRGSDPTPGERLIVLTDMSTAPPSAT